jgi:hypothetical protein
LQRKLQPMNNPGLQRFLRFIAKNNAEVRIVLENLLPLLIMVFAGWSPLLVLFYFFLDLLVKLSLEFFKYRKIVADRIARKQLKTEKKGPIVGYLVSAMVLVSITFILTLIAGTGMELNKTGWNEALNELWKIVKVDYWIIPLLGFNGWMLYKMEFIKQMQYRILPPKGYLKGVIGNSIPMVLLLGGAAILVLFTSIGALYATLIFILCNTVSDFLLLRRSQKKLKEGLTIS